MNDSKWIEDNILKLIRSFHGASYFINGAPGSGKSFLLAQLGNNLKERLFRSVIIGPILPESLISINLGRLMIANLEQQGWLETIPQTEMDLPAAWEYISNTNAFSSEHSIIVLIDLSDIYPNSISEVGELLSQSRSLETHNPCPAKVMHIFAGFWDHPSLRLYFDKIKTSFPYDDNYEVWNGITSASMLQLFQGNSPDIQPMQLSAKLLHEISGANPGLALELLEALGGKAFTFGNLLTVAKEISRHGQYASVLQSIWQELPSDSRNFIRILLNQKRIRASLVLPPALERLKIAGVIVESWVGNRSYIEFRSWFIEAFFQNHAEEFDLLDPNIAVDGISELVPKHLEICVEAYRLIHEVENLIRNFVAIQLWKNYAAGDLYPLEGRVIRYSDFSKCDEDAYERAIAWKERNRARGVSSVDLNSTLAYLSTRDLATLVKEIGNENEWLNWQKIADNLDKLSGVRDAVMHNQLIDYADLDQLYILKTQIYNALCE